MSQRHRTGAISPPNTLLGVLTPPPGWGALETLPRLLGPSTTTIGDELPVVDVEASAGKLHIGEVRHENALARAVYVWPSPTEHACGPDGPTNQVQHPPASTDGAGVRWVQTARPPSSQRIVETSTGMEGDGQVTQLQDALAQANGFLPDALPANRSGRLTAAQAESLRRKQSSMRRTVFLVGLVLAGGPAIYAGVKVVQSGRLSVLNGDGPWGFLVIGLLLMGLGLFWRGYQADITRAAVHSVEGTGRKRVIHHAEDPDSYCYLIGGMQFEVTEQGYQALPEGVRYRAYYVPRSGEIVNIEVLGPATPSAAPPAAVPVCPICGRSDRLRDAEAYLQVMGQAHGCAWLLLPLVALVGKSPVAAAREQQARQRQIQVTVARLPPMYTCRRDRVVFVPGAGKSVRTVELVRMLRQGSDAETTARALGVLPE